jgi:tRNA(adenine34) deaminase
VTHLTPDGHDVTQPNHRQLPDSATVGTAAEAWTGLDGAWRAAFEQAWEAFATGNIGVGAAATDADGRIVAIARNRVADTSAPPGQVFGSTLAHAETNVIAQLPFGHPRELTLTTTLQPCLQCSAAIRMAPIARVRVAGADPLWHGTHDFGTLNTWLARREPVPVEGPLPGRLGAFATLMARMSPHFRAQVDDGLRERGEGDLLDLKDLLVASGERDELAHMRLVAALDRLWERLPT